MRKTPGIPVWQRNYYEHIIRGEEELNRIREYIVNNPSQWYNNSIVGAHGRAPLLPIHGIDNGRINSYTIGRNEGDDMKTAISMPDDLFLLVDKRAKKMNISRSEFIASAVRDYAERQNNHEIFEALNHVYLERETEKEKNLRDKSKSYYAALLGEEEW